MTPEQIIKKFEQLKSARSTWESHWQEVTDYVLPRKNDILQTQTPGQKKGIQLYDSTAVQANEMLAGAFHGMLTSLTSPWFEYTTGASELDQDDDVREWLQDSASKTHSVLNHSNFHTEIHETYLDINSLGTAPLLIEEDPLDVVRFSARSVSEVVVDENSKGDIDETYRQFSWTPKQIAQAFGIKNLPDIVKRKLDSDKEEKFEIIHAVYPRSLEGLSEEKKKAPKGYPYADCYVLKKTKEFLKEGGFREFPWAIPRWSKITGELYGRSPAMKVLAEIKMINKMKETILRGAMMTVSPPLQAPDDGFINKINLNALAINYYRSGTQDRIEPIITNARIDYGREALNDIRNAIREGFYIDQLQLTNGPQMTAEEVRTRTEERMRLLGPVLGRQNKELLKPLIDRVFGIMYRRNMFKKPPAKLSGRVLNVHYSSQIAKAQKVGEAQQILRAMELSSPFFQADPSTLDIVEMDEGVKTIFRRIGVSETIIRNDSDIKKRRKARADAQAQAAQAQQEAHQAELAQKAGPSLIKAKEAGMI